MASWVFLGFGAGPFQLKANGTPPVSVQILILWPVHSTHLKRRAHVAHGLVDLVRVVLLRPFARAKRREHLRDGADEQRVDNEPDHGAQARVGVVPDVSQLAGEVCEVCEVRCVRPQSGHG